MGTHKKVIDQIKVDLLSNNDQLIKKALTKTRDKGNEQLIDPLFELYSTTKEEVIKEEVKGIFAEIKNKNSIKDKNNTMIVLAWNFYNDIKKNNSIISDNFVNIKDLEQD